MSIKQTWNLKLADLLNSKRMTKSVGTIYPPPLKREGKYHIDFIVHLAQIMQPMSYLEVGIFQSGLFNKMIPFAEQCTAVDIDPNLKKYINPSQKVTFFGIPSKDFWNLARANEFEYDFIFVDGDHSKEAVEADFLGALSVLRNDGILLLHDTYPMDVSATSSERCGDGFKAIWKLGKQQRDYELMTIPVHPGLTIVRKRNGQVPWDLS